MVKRIKKHFKNVLPLRKPLEKEILRSQKATFPLNISQNDRISFSVLKNDINNIRKIENISYEININDQWEWVIRYDDHGGTGSLHRHVRISLEDESDVESASGIKRYRNKNYELTWVCNDIKRNYLNYRKKFLKNSELDLY